MQSRRIVGIFFIISQVVLDCSCFPSSSLGSISSRTRTRRTYPYYTSRACSSKSIDSERSRWNPVNSDKTISNILICGDGDLSFSATIAESLSQSRSKSSHLSNIQITATVLEDKITHEAIYQRSKTNQHTITSSSNHHQIQFGIDATKLEEHFPNQIGSFDRIQFNFPHWRGKANHKYNRQLIDAFLQSASKMISVTEETVGEIHIAFVQGQGGFTATSMKDYRDTWTPSYYANEHGLLLRNVMPYEPMYNLSSHRGVDRGFKIGAEPKMFIYSKPNGPELAIERQYQQCCRHELHVLVPESESERGRLRQDQDPPRDENEEVMDKKSHVDTSAPAYSLDDILFGDAVQRIIENVVPDGIRVEIPTRTILQKRDTGYETDMAVFAIVYCGEYCPMKRNEADHYRHLAELEMEKYITLRENRKGRLVSKPFPYKLLDSIMEDYSTASNDTPTGPMEHETKEGNIHIS